MLHILGDSVRTYLFTSNQIPAPFRKVIDSPLIYLCIHLQFRRSVLKHGGQGQSGQAIKLFQITPYVNDFQTLNIPGSWEPVGTSKD